MKKILSIFLWIAASATAYGDPYHWLEEDSERTRAWVGEQRAQSEAYFAELDSKEIEAELRALASQETWWIPKEKDGKLYFCKRSAGENKAVLVRKADEKIDVLVDPNLSDREEMLIGFSISPNGRYLSYGLSIAGSDQLEWRILDLESRMELPERLDEIQFSEAVWDESNEKVYYVKNCSEVYAHKLGAPVSEDTLLYRPEGDIFVYRPQIMCKGRYLLVEERRQVVKQVGIRLIDLEDMKTCELVQPGEFDVTPVGSLDDEILSITDENCCMGKLIAIDAQGKQRTLIEEGRDLMQEVEVVGDKLVCSYLEDACASLKVFDLEGRYLYAIPLPGKGTAAIASSNETLFYSYTDFYTPMQIYSHNVNARTTKPLHTPTASCGKIVTEQVWYTSKDGTRIPMFLTRRKDTQLDEKTPVLLYGYGGFGIPVTPFFRSYQVYWVQAGGVLAVPNIRGGKEYGKDWYDNGKLNKKQNVFDDFICAAEWLHSRKTGPIGIFGTSNGGLLIGAVLTQRPDLFDAAVVNKGVLDMLRFHLFTIGRFWICDYGNPEDPDDYGTLLSYSPYHNVRKGTCYPATLVNTADHDDRVVPMHSFKFFAALKEANSSENPILLRLEESCGHGGSDSCEQEVAFGRDLLGFFYSELSFKKEAILSEMRFCSE